MFRFNDNEIKFEYNFLYLSVLDSGISKKMKKNIKLKANQEKKDFKEVIF